MDNGPIIKRVMNKVLRFHEIKILIDFGILAYHEPSLSAIIMQNCRENLLYYSVQTATPLSELKSGQSCASVFFAARNICCLIWYIYLFGRSI